LNLFLHLLLYAPLDFRESIFLKKLAETFYLGNLESNLLRVIIFTVELYVALRFFGRIEIDGLIVQRGLLHMHLVFCDENRPFIFLSVAITFLHTQRRMQDETGHVFLCLQNS